VLGEAGDALLGQGHGVKTYASCHAYLGQRRGVKGHASCMQCCWRPVLERADALRQIGRVCTCGEAVQPVSLLFMGFCHIIGVGSRQAQRNV
jgi:hypothetical protein